MDQACAIMREKQLSKGSTTMIRHMTICSIYDLDVSSNGGEGLFVEAKSFNKERKGKGKHTLEDALREASLRDDQSDRGAPQTERFSLQDAGLIENQRQPSYQDQQDVPDEIAGFQPDMDPRLREVLVALDDDAFVDDEEEVFAKIASQPGEVSKEEFEATDFLDEENDDDWESDTTEKPTIEDPSLDTVSTSSTDTDMSDAPSPGVDNGDGEWMKEFHKFKQDQKPAPVHLKGRLPAASVQSYSLARGPSGIQRKKRKGALTSSAGYSMTSSSLARTEGQSLLDARFDKMERLYADDEMDMDADDTASTLSMLSKDSRLSAVSHLSKASNISKLSTASSQAPDVTAQGYDAMMDDFLGAYKMAGGGKRVSAGQYRTGMQQLDDVRKELGSARVKTQRAS